MATELDRDLAYALSLDQWHAMVAAGVLDGEPVELLRGQPVRMTPQGPAHAGVLGRLHDHFLALHAAGELRIRVRMPLTLAGVASEPEPDLALVEPRIDLAAHPTTARLVAEVAISSATVDRGLKAAVYAGAGIPEYWLIDVAARRVEVRRGPARDGYGAVELLAAGELLTVEGLDHPPLAVSVVLAGL